MQYLKLEHYLFYDGLDAGELDHATRLTIRVVGTCRVGLGQLVLVGKLAA